MQCVLFLFPDVRIPTPCCVSRQPSNKKGTITTRKRWQATALGGELPPSSESSKSLSQKPICQNKKNYIYISRIQMSKVWLIRKRCISCDFKWSIMCLSSSLVSLWLYIWTFRHAYYIISPSVYLPLDTVSFFLFYNIFIITYHPVCLPLFVFCFFFFMFSIHGVLLTFVLREFRCVIRWSFFD